MNQQLEREKSERLRLESELNRLKNLQKTLPIQTPNQPPKPTIATVVILPFSGSRDGADNNVKTIKLEANIKNVTVTLQLPKEVAAEIFLVRFEDAIVASKQKSRTTKSGLKFVTVKLSADRLSTTEDNVISVIGNDGVRYDFVLKVQK